MNKGGLSLAIGSGPDIHGTIITSIVLHLLFIAIVAVPPMTKEREEKRYFVDLVSPAEIRNQRDSALPDKPDRMPEKIVTAEIKKTELHRAVPEENRNKMTPPGNPQNTLPEPLQKTGDEIITPGGDVQKAKWRDRQDSIPINKVQREPTLAPGEGLQKQQYMIARADKPVRTSPEPLDKGYREQAFEGKEEFQEQQFTITGKDKHVRKKSEAKSLESDANGNSGFGLKRNIEIDHLEQPKGALAIEKPLVPAKSGEGEIARKRRDEQTSEEADLKRETEKYGNDKLSSSEISIQGVPLNDLIACPNALDERALKKKILKIIGENKICVNPADGKFVFSGTGRITSFDMIIMPVSGRKLSNRCKELENAYSCLTLVKE